MKGSHVQHEAVIDVSRNPSNPDKTSAGRPEATADALIEALSSAGLHVHPGTWDLLVLWVLAVERRLSAHVIAELPQRQTDTTTAALEREAERRKCVAAAESQVVAGPNGWQPTYQDWVQERNNAVARADERDEFARKAREWEALAKEAFEKLDAVLWGRWTELTQIAIAAGCEPNLEVRATMAATDEMGPVACAVREIVAQIEAGRPAMLMPKVHKRCLGEITPSKDGQREVCRKCGTSWLVQPSARPQSASAPASDAGAKPDEMVSHALRRLLMATKDDDASLGDITWCAVDLRKALEQGPAKRVEIVVNEVLP